MKLSSCQSCEHHICVMGKKVLCGFHIDREEKLIKEEDNIKQINDCPLEKTTRNK